MCFSTVLAWMDKRRSEILNIGDTGETEVVKITDVKEYANTSN